MKSSITKILSALPKQKISLRFSFSFFAPHFLRAKGKEIFWFRLAGAERKRTISFGATTRGARGQSGFCSKKVRISSKQYRQFTISAFCGESGIRTRGGLNTLTRFPSERLRPLSHLSRRSIYYLLPRSAATLSLTGGCVIKNL